mmetsp:Transcript_28013/g.91824  ORF Transcript_28013/g.91824 Transcript_28013/m.91824 type:complete len:205 (+) Transcript_28013:107-721(+)
MKQLSRDHRGGVSIGSDNGRCARSDRPEAASGEVQQREALHLHGARVRVLRQHLGHHRAISVVKVLVASPLRGVETVCARVEALHHAVAERGAQRHAHVRTEARVRRHRPGNRVGGRAAALSPRKSVRVARDVDGAGRVEHNGPGRGFGAEPATAAEAHEHHRPVNNLPRLAHTEVHHWCAHPCGHHADRHASDGARVRGEASR